MESQEKSRLSDKHESILAAATQAFRDEGFECTSMDRISELAGASKRTVYNHFGSKEALFQAVVARLFEESLTLKEAVWEPERPLEDQLAEIVRAKTSLSDDKPALCLTRVVLGVYIRQPELLREVVQRLGEDDSALAGWFREADRAGKLSVPDPDLAAHVFAKMTAGVLFWPQLLDGRMESDARESLTRELVQMVLARYRPAPG